MINEIIAICRTADIVIFCSHRVRPVPSDIHYLVSKIKEGYGLVMLRKMACFGFSLELIKRIGFLDERYIPGGYEDDDFYIRMKEANISIYDEERVKYIAGASLWSQPLYAVNDTDFKQPITYDIFRKKWKRDGDTMYRLLEEQNYCYNLGPINPDIKFKDFSQSVTTLQLPKYIKKQTNIVNKRILIIGGTGSLGNKIIEMYGSSNDIVIFSRDENKHWLMKQQYANQSKRLAFCMGDIRDLKTVQETLEDVNPHIIIIAAALKHIDTCEYEVMESIKTNTLGPMNVLKAVKNCDKTFKLQCLESVIYISTDKACFPINTYGICKSLSEKAVIEQTFKMPFSRVKFVNVRYGNVLNSRGSIIPKLRDSTESHYTLTHQDMTRFIMTQEEAVQLIEYAILNGNSGDTIIPKIKCMKIIDLFEIYAEKTTPAKEIRMSSLRPGEKMSEALLNENEIRRTIEQDGYYIIKPDYTLKDNKCEFVTLNSYDSADKDICLSKDELKQYLQSKGFL
jgi:dTDP-4-dehydrorhamnose reductase